MSFYDKFKPERYTIKEFKNWIVVLRMKQKTLGSAVIILKRQVGSIGDATGDELSEFPTVVRWYEEKCKKLFGAEKFNYLAAMMKDNFVHFHAFPRYSKELNFADVCWKDEDWPRPVNPAGAETDLTVLEKILNEFKNS